MACKKLTIFTILFAVVSAAVSGLVYAFPFGVHVQHHSDKVNKSTNESYGYGPGRVVTRECTVVNNTTVCNITVEHTSEHYVNTSSGMEHYHAVEIKITITKIMPEIEKIKNATIRKRFKEEIMAINKSTENISIAEKRIHNINPIWKFLFGTDFKAVHMLEQERNKIELRLQTMENMLNQVQNEQVKLKIREMIRELQQEMDKVNQEIEQEKKNVGIFGWILRFFYRK